jgi:glycosyltransferase involved in cell wall biosynthesis
MRMSLVIPCYNEEKNIPELLKRCIKAVQSPGVEVVLVDNGSTDGTSRILSELLPSHPGCRCVRVPVNKGYGFGILEGLRAAKGNVLAWTHADMQTDPVDVLKGLSFFEEHGDSVFVKGRRFGRPWSDVFFTCAMGVFESFLLRLPLWDINAQPTMFSKSFFSTWENPPHDFSLDLFAYYQAKKQGLRVFRFPVYFGKRLHGVSHWNIDWKSKKKFIERTVRFSVQLRKDMQK